MLLRYGLIYPVGISKSCHYAASYLKDAGFTLIDHPSPDITHLLLDVPSFSDAGQLTDGSGITDLLRTLPPDITVIGGNLRHSVLSDYNTVDLLSDPYFLAKNAAITAECALQIAATHSEITFRDASVLILGWGRIGKHLAHLLKHCGCQLTIAARNEKDRAFAESLGMESVDFKTLCNETPDYNILFNTIPAVTLCQDTFRKWDNVLKIDLASSPGILCSDVISARGLPGTYAPASAGRLIAQSVCRLIKEDME